MVYTCRLFNTMRSFFHAIMRCPDLGEGLPGASWRVHCCRMDYTNKFINVLNECSIQKPVPANIRNWQLPCHRAKDSKDHCSDRIETESEKRIRRQRPRAARRLAVRLPFDASIEAEEDWEPWSMTTRRRVWKNTKISRCKEKFVYRCRIRLRKETTRLALSD